MPVNENIWNTEADIGSMEATTANGTTMAHLSGRYGGGIGAFGESAAALMWNKRLAHQSQPQGSETKDQKSLVVVIVSCITCMRELRNENPAREGVLVQDTLDL